MKCFIHSQVAELVRRTIRGFSAYRRGIQNEKRTGSNPVLTTRFGSSPNSMPNTMRNELITHMGLMIGEGSIRFD